MRDAILPIITTIEDLPGPISTGATDHNTAPRAVQSLSGWRWRTAARNIIHWGDRVALQKMTADNAIKLPGGGMQIGEDGSRAATRELGEEVGLILDDSQLALAGVALEYRDKWRMAQITYVFTGEVTDPASQIREPTEAGSELLWAPSMQDAIGALAGGNSADPYGWEFMKMRDTAILRFLIDTQNQAP
jgi:ADP-ribose pyrophosphatase YjhB (NUDIX family)